MGCFQFGIERLVPCDMPKYAVISVGKDNFLVKTVRAKVAFISKMCYSVHVMKYASPHEERLVVLHNIDWNHAQKLAQGETV